MQCDNNDFYRIKMLLHFTCMCLLKMIKFNEQNALNSFWNCMVFNQLMILYNAFPFNIQFSL